MSVKKPKVKLTGADGNAFMIMGLCFAAAKKAGFSAEKIAEIRKQMTSGDYDNLLCVAVTHFDVR